MRDKLPRGSSVTLNAKPWHLVLTSPGGTTQNLSQGIFCRLTSAKLSLMLRGSREGSHSSLIELCPLRSCRIELNTGPGTAILRKTCWPRWPSVSIWEHGFHPYLMGVAHCISRIRTDNVIYAKCLLPLLGAWDFGMFRPYHVTSPSENLLGTECLMSISVDNIHARVAKSLDAGEIKPVLGDFTRRGL